MQAQDLFKTVRDNATKVVNNPNSSDEEIQINQFKVTALNYLSMMVQKRGLKKDTYFYDSQAVNMTSFITDFQVNLEKARAISPAKRMEIMKIYTDASKFNPMFKDTDKERANAYVNDKSTLDSFLPRHRLGKGIRQGRRMKTIKINPADNVAVAIETAQGRRNH